MRCVIRGSGERNVRCADDISLPMRRMYRSRRVRWHGCVESSARLSLVRNPEHAIGSVNSADLTKNVHRLPVARASTTLREFVLFAGEHCHQRSALWRQQLQCGHRRHGGCSIDIDRCHPAGAMVGDQGFLFFSQHCSCSRNILLLAALDRNLEDHKLVPSY